MAILKNKVNLKRMLISMTMVSSFGLPIEAADTPRENVALQSSKVEANYTASWNNINAVKNGTKGFGELENNETWGDWSEKRPANGWIAYTWDDRYVVDSVAVYYWTDSSTPGHGVNVPASWTVQYYDEASSAWKDVTVTGGSYSVQRSSANGVAFTPVEVKQLRLWMNAATDGKTYSALGVTEFEVWGHEAGTTTVLTDTLDLSATMEPFTDTKATTYATVAVSADKEQVASLLGVTADELTSLYGSKITYAAVNPDGTLNTVSTAKAPGHWFDAKGNVVSWGSNAYVFSELNMSTLTFSLGQYPARCSDGNEYTMMQALTYRPSDGASEIHRVIFRLHLKVEKMPETITISEDDTAAPEAKNNVNIKLNRSLKAGVWNTFCVPFDMAKPQGWSVKILTKAEGNVLTFEDAASIEAGKPYMVMPQADVTTVTADGVNITPTVKAVTVDGYTMTGTFSPIYVPQGAYFINNNVFYLADKTDFVSLKGYRAYITASKQSAKSLVVDIDGQTTAITSLNNDDTYNGSSPMYNLAGQKVGNDYKGIVIKNGKKYINK